MKKKIIAIIIELIPIISTIISFLLIAIPYNSRILKKVIEATFLLSSLGFVFFFIGHKIDKENKIVKFLGILDCIATLFIIAIYIIAIFSFGL